MRNIIAHRDTALKAFLAAKGAQEMPMSVRLLFNRVPIRDGIFHNWRGEGQ